MGQTIIALITYKSAHYPLRFHQLSGINKVILVGHLGKDPELRTLDDDVAVVSFPLATSEFINKNGQKTEQTEWHNIVLWRGLAEAAANILKKGKLIYLEGKCRTRSFEDKMGNKKYTTEIIGESFTLLGRNYDFPEDMPSAKTDNDYEDNPDGGHLV